MSLILQTDLLTEYVCITYVSEKVSGEDFLPNEKRSLNL